MKSKGVRREERKGNGESLTPRNLISGPACAWLADDMRSDGGRTLYIIYRSPDGWCAVTITIHFTVSPHN